MRIQLTVGQRAYVKGEFDLSVSSELLVPASSAPLLSYLVKERLRFWEKITYDCLSRFPGRSESVPGLEREGFEDALKTMMDVCARPGSKGKVLYTYSRLHTKLRMKMGKWKERQFDNPRQTATRNEERHCCLLPVDRLFVKIGRT